MWQAGRSADAFTLLEVLIVVAILALVGAGAGLTYPDLQGRSRLAQAETWLEQELANLRRQAQWQGRLRSLEFDWRNARYRASDQPWRSLPADVRWSSSSSDPTTGRMLVIFLPDGTGTGAHIMMAVGSRSSVARVDPLTGTLQK